MYKASINKVINIIIKVVQFRIHEKSTLQLMPRLHTTSNQGVLGLIGKIRRLSFQCDCSHMQLKYESTGMYETI
jgi:hypothetical protein